MSEFEVRDYSAQLASIGLEERDGQEDRIVGYGAVFYDGTPGTEFQLSEDVYERIAPGAFDNVIKEGHDVLGLFNHNRDYLLGRTGNGTMRLSVDGTGLRYDIEPGDTTIARDVKKMLKRGDVHGSSFAFIVDDERFIRDGKKRIREVRSVRVRDVGPVTEPAYKGSSAKVSKRSLDELEKELPVEVKAEEAREEQKPTGPTTEQLRRRLSLLEKE